MQSLQRHPVVLARRVGYKMRNDLQDPILSMIYCGPKLMIRNISQVLHKMDSLPPRQFSPTHILIFRHNFFFIAQTYLNISPHSLLSIPGNGMSQYFKITRKIQLSRASHDRSNLNEITHTSKFLWSLPLIWQLNSAFTV